MEKRKYIYHIDIILLVLFIFLVRVCRQHLSYADPSSYFFDQPRAYAERPHSELREFEATQFIARVSAASPKDSARKHSSTAAAAAAAAAATVGAGQPVDTPHICIGIPSIKREKENFLDRTIGSLVDTLSYEERQSITLIVLLVDQDPRENPYYGAGWLDTIPDIVFTYADGEGRGARAGTRSSYRQLPATYSPRSPRNVRARLDNAALVSACEDQQADYFLLIEDDVVASADWFSKLNSSIHEIESKHLRNDWLYIRLFHTDLYLGWNTEEYPKYLPYIVLTWSSIALVAILQRQVWLKLYGQELEPMRVCLRRLRLCSPRLIVWLFAFTMLYFLAGRQVVQPLRHGLQEMPRYGCCGQGLLFPSRHLQLLGDELREPMDEPVDSCIGRIAEEERLEKWAIVPSVLQHIGVRGSSSQHGIKKQTWSFAFEHRKMPSLSDVTRTVNG